MRPGWGAQINGLQRKSLICKESENDTFRFPWSKKATNGLFTTHHYQTNERFFSFRILPSSLRVMTRAPATAAKSMSELLMSKCSA
jgi:hypothetical protein